MDKQIDENNDFYIKQLKELYISVSSLKII